MSEPITLYDAKGEAVIVYGKAQAAALIEAGAAMQEKPVKDAAEAAKKESEAQAGKAKSSNA